jgi:vacuolar protein-sorting-associated protein 4
VEADRQERYGDALTLYVQSAEAFVEAATKAATSSKASAIKSKAIEYVQRAEAIRELLDRHPQMARRRAEATVVLPPSGDSNATDVVEQTVVSERPNVRWTDIVGASDAKSALKEAIVLPLRFPDAYRQARLKPWSGILLYGPPGTGKTLLAKAAAAESQATFFAVSASAILSKWLGESSRRIRELFDEARRRSPSVIFVDEVDSMLTERREDDGGKRQVKTEFFVQMDGMHTDDDARVLVLAATNTPWSLDEAAMRRFEQRIYVPLPTPEARRTLFGDLASTDAVQATDGYSAADVASIVRLARMQPMREACTAERFVRHEDGTYEATGGDGGEAMSLEQVPDNQLRLRPISFDDVLHAVQRTPASVTNQTLERFERWRHK